MPCTLSPEEELWEEREANKRNRNIKEAITDRELLTKIACAGMRHMESTGESGDTIISVVCWIIGFWLIQPLEGYITVRSFKELWSRMYS